MTPRTRTITQAIGALVLFTLIAWSGPFQKEKEASARMTQSEWYWIIQQIDDSPTPGAERKMVIKKIMDQIQPQFADTTRTPASKPKQ